MNRRQFLQTSSLAAAMTALAACQSARPWNALPTPTALAPTPTGAPPPLPDDETLLLHTLRRITFGPTPAEVEHARAIGRAAFIDEQLNPQNLPDDTGARLSDFATLTMDAPARLVLEQFGRPIAELVLATLVRQVYSPRQLFETLVDFWTNHFNIFIAKSLDRVLKTDDDRDVVRAHALGRFADLLTASAHSPAMLVYLDNAQSTAGVPNENYARELMELHTLGVDGGYTQLDVSDVARALTGWSVTGRRDPRPGEFIFRQRLHDSTEKFILGRKFPAGRGKEEGDELLALLAAHSSTARYISFKLARRFVADEPPAALVAALAEIFQAAQGDLPAVLRALFNSPEFKVSAGQKLKRPLEFFVSALRVTGAEVSRPQPLLEHLRALGQVPFMWQTPDGYPDYAAPWTNTGGLLARWNFALLLTSNQVRGTRVDVERLAGGPASPAAAVDALSRQFFGAPLPADAREILVRFAEASGSNLPALAGLMLGSPHFQMR